MANTHIKSTKSITNNATPKIAKSIEKKISKPKDPIEKMREILERNNVKVIPYGIENF